ncbi:hypothetical protein CCACVL1_16806 [Corchorus capsularis]|uniref:Uncharacterized protein n=1 Tax=Corchorus capsularis TaxID=210143 RepID=A0A1R3HVB2_COCAP|nr:hypothetical protein CCACVL1_16806 [Corchorus capsularis]
MQYKRRKKEEKRIFTTQSRVLRLEGGKILDLTT